MLASHFSNSLRGYARTFLAGATSLLMMSQACADVLIWDANSLTAGSQDGTGVWTLGQPNWLNSTLALENQVWADGNAAVFGSGSGTAGVVTLGGPITLTDLTFNAATTGNYTLGGSGVLTLGALIVTTNAAATISTVLAGTTAWSKQGTEQLTLSGSLSNTNTGTLTLGAGRVHLSKTGATALAGDVNITGGSLTYSGGTNQIVPTANVTVSGVGSGFNGTGPNAGTVAVTQSLASLTMNGGTFNAGSNSVWNIGAVSFVAGTDRVFVGNSASVQTFGSLSLAGMNGASSSTAVANGFTLFGNGGAIRTSLTIGSGGLAMDGSRIHLGGGTGGSQLVLNGDVTTTGVAGSSIERVAGGAVAPFLSLSGTAGTVDRTFNIGGGGANMNIGTIINNGAATTASLIKTGAGTLTLSGTEANTFTGTTTINGGTLALSKTAGITAVVGDIVVNTGGSLTMTTSNVIADTAGITVNGGTVNPWITNETVAFYTQNSGGLTASGNVGQVVITGALTLAGGNQLVLNSSTSPTPGHWNVGSAILTGADILLGGNNGAGNPRTALTIGAGGLTLQGRTITLNAGTAGTVLNLNGGLTSTGSGSINNGGGAGFAPLLQLASTQIFQITNGTTTIGVEVAGAGGITMEGNGLLQMTAANSYTGPTAISGGTLSVAGVGGRLSGTTSITVNGGGTLQNGSPTLANNNGVADRINPAATLTLGSATGGATFRMQSAAAGSHTQTLNSLSIGGGSNTVSVLANASTVASLTFGSANPYVRTAGSVNFVQNPVVGGSIFFTNAPSGAGNVSGGLLVGATLNGADLIAAQPGVLTAFSGWVPTGTNTWTAGAAMDVTGTNPVAYPATTISALRFNTPGPFTVTLDGSHGIESDMILVTPTAGAGVQIFTGGQLSGSAGSSLIVSQNNTAGSLSIGSTLVDNGGASGLTKTGLGLLTLTGANTYTGITRVEQGVLRAADGVGLPTASALILTGGVIEPTTATFNRALGSGAGEVRLVSGAGGFSASGSALAVNLGGAAGTLQWGSTHFNPTALVLNASTADSALQLVNGLDLNGSSREIRVEANTATVTGLISNSVIGSPSGVIKTGLGTLLLPTANTYNGTTVITAGTLAIGDDLAMSAGTVQLNGGTLRTETAARVLANPISVTGASFLSSAHGLTLNGTLTNTGGNQSITTTLTGPAVLDINGNVFLSELSTVSRQLSFFGSGTRNINGVIANNAGDNALASHLFFNGSGLLNLNAQNTYTGRTLAAGGGYIVISQDRNLGATPVAPVVDSLILAANGSLRAAATFELNINRGIGIGNSSGGTATGFIDVVANQVFTVAGSIADRTRNNDGTLTPANVGALSKTGTGVLVLSGANNYSGITTVSQGIVRLASNSALGGTSAGTLVTSAAHVELMNGVVITGETLTLNGGSGTVGTGSPDASRGGLQAAANASAEWAGNIVLGANNSRIGVQNGGTLLLSGNISDGGSNHTLVFSGDLIGTASGPGAVVIAGTNNTWGGSTQIVRGTVKLGAHNTLPTATVLDIHFTAANNAEYAGLDMNGFNQSVGRLQNGGATGANAVLTNSSATLSTMTVNEATSGSYAGVITGNVALAKTGAGVMTLTQANSYTGGTLIQEGTIRFGAGGALAQGNVTILGGATTGGTLDLNNITTATINGLSGGAGAVTGLIVNDSTTNATRTLSVGVNHATSTYSGRIIDNNGGTAQGKVALAKIGTGALTLSGANTHTGSTAVSNGSIIADFGSNHALGSSPIVLQGGTLVVSNATAATIGTVSLLQSGADFTRGVLRIDNAATITTSSFIGSGFAPFLLDISSGGTFVASALSGMSVTNGVLVQGGSNRSTLYVQDSSGIGFATRNASNEIVRYTAGTAATATNSSSSTNFTLGSSLTRTAELQFHTLDINTDGGPVTLTMGSNNLSASGATGRGILISGTNDATITATSGVIGGGSVFISNYSTGTTTLDISLNGQATILAGPGLVDYTKTANPADLYVANGTFRMSGGSRDFNTGITRIFGDGVLEIGADLNAAADGDFTRVVGQGVNNVALIGNGGFSAHGADRVVALGGTAAPAALVWGANNFFSGPGGDNNYAFKLGSASSTHALEFRNAIDLGNRSRIVDVADGTTVGSNVDARLTGVLTGTGGSLIKAGSGRLEVTALNSYTGTTRVQSGTLQLAATGTTGTGAVTVDSGATLIGTGTVRGSSFDLSSGGALQAGNGTAVSDHGTLTFNPIGVGQYDFQTGSTVSLSLQTATNQGTIDPTFGGHAIGSVEYNAYVDALGGVGSGLHDLLVFNGTSGSTLSFSSNLNVVPDGFTAQAGQVFNLMDWVNLMSTDFSGFNVGANYRDGTGDNLSQFDLPELTGGLVWDVSRFTTSGAIVVVPEPSRMLLLAFPLVGMLFSRRRM